METRLQLQKIYLKRCIIDVTEEAENIELLTNSTVNFKLTSNHQALELPSYRITLNLTAEVKTEEKILATIEIEKAGLFTIENFSADALEHLLQAYCPNLIYPYLRERASELSLQAGLKPFTLPLMDFNAIYQQQKQAKVANA